MIVSISFLISESERVHVQCVSGKFQLRRKKHGLLRTREIIRSLTAKELIEVVKERDPFITMKTGEKFRVFRGGDATSEVVEIFCLVESHDIEVIREKKKKEKALKEKTQKAIITDYRNFLDYPDDESW